MRTTITDPCIYKNLGVFCRRGLAPAAKRRKDLNFAGTKQDFVGVVRERGEYSFIGSIFKGSFLECRTFFSKKVLQETFAGGCLKWREQALTYYILWLGFLQIQEHLNGEEKKTVNRGKRLKTA